jgi:MHS family proline/betaine transporter-like MFS transporter
MTNNADPRAPESAVRRAVVAASVGNCLEWFDFAVYGFLAATLGALFFPSENETASLLASFAVFGAAFVVRPLGGLFFGPLGDKIGRRGVLAAIILLMSAATFAIGLLPTYATIGILAPVLLVVLRLLQGFTAGGELTGATTFVAEYSPDARRGFLTSWIQVSATLGFLLGLITPTLLTAIFGAEALSSWGWRVPFLLAGPLGVIGLYIRLKLEDTPDFRELEHEGEVAGNPLIESLTRNWGPILLVGSVGIIVHLGYFLVLVYMPTYLTGVQGLEQTTAFFATAIGLLVDIALIPLAGALSDRVGRKPLLIGACIGFAVLTFPVFLLISQGGALYAILGLSVLGALHGIYLGAVAATFAEIFATYVRYGGFSIGHNISAAIFGGGAPFLAAYLASTTGSSFVPAFIIVAGALGSLAAVVILKETAGLPLKKT